MRSPFTQELRSSKQQHTVRAATQSNGSCCLPPVLAYAVVLPYERGLRWVRTVRLGSSSFEPLVKP